MDSLSRHASPLFSCRLLPLGSKTKRVVVAAATISLGAFLAVVISGRPSKSQHGGSSDHYLRYEHVVDRFLEEDGCELDCCRQFEETLCPSENGWISALPFAVSILLIIILLCMSALFSGLTLGLMSLDKTGLEVVMAGDDAQSAAYAKNIYPVRDNGNLLLCTLLLGNVAVNALLSILLAEYTGGTTGFISSTFLIVIFGEIVPQAVCSRYALRVGSATIPIVKVIRMLLFPLAGPLGWCLDKVLGRELASTYSNAEMLKLLQIHVQENVIDQVTAGAMTGALTYKDIAVKNVMTPMEKTFMLSVDEKLSFETIAKIFRTGYSRIPVYEVSRNNIIGLLFVKDLIFIDPEDDTPIRNFVQIFGRGVHVVWPDDKLGDVLAELKQGRSHLALVRDVNNSDGTQDPFYEVKGIITLEDIIEKIIGDTIVDETDAFIDNTQSIKVDRGEGFEWARLRLLDTKIVDETLSYHEVKAVIAHLRVNHPDLVSMVTDFQLERLVSETPVSQLPTATREMGKQLPNELLYEKGVHIDVCTLVLGGKVTITVGADNFRSVVSSWSLLGANAITEANYVPDFTAFVSDGPCRCIRISYQRFAEVVDASAVEKLNGGDRQPTNSSMVSTTSDSANPMESIAELKEAIEPPNRREKLIAALQSFRGESGSDIEGVPASSADDASDGGTPNGSKPQIGSVHSDVSDGPTQDA